MVENLLISHRFFIVSLIRLKTIGTFTTTTNPTSKPTPVHQLYPERESTAHKEPAPSDMTAGDFVDVGIWSGIEIYVGCLCPCLPAIRVLLMRYWARWTGWTTSGSESNLQHQARLQASSVQRNRLRKQSQGESAQVHDGDATLVLQSNVCYASYLHSVSSDDKT